jgi:hypothetical protein
MPTVTETWIGGGNNDASNPKDWTPQGAPSPGEDLVIKDGTINIAGNDLAGDTLKLDSNSLTTPTTNIDTKNGAVLNLGGAVYDDATINVNIVGKLNLTADVGQVAGTLSFIGGSINLVGTSTFQSAVFDTNLKGTGTIDANHPANGDIFGPYVFNGSVGRGVTIALEGGGPPESVQIAHPSSFKGEITLPSNEPFLGSVLFEGLHVTRADLVASTDVLQMWDGKHLVDTVRLGGNTSNLVVLQTATGATLSTTGLSHQPVAGNLFH